MYARTADGVDMKGKADVLIRSDESAMITDLENYCKVRQVFQNRAVNALRFAVSGLHASAASSLELDPALVKFAYCVVESRRTIPRAVHDCRHRLC